MSRLESLRQEADLDIDTGAAVSILSKKIFQQLFSGVKLKPSSLLLKMYMREHMQILGTLAVKVRYLSQGPFDLELVVVSGDGPCLVGKDWLQVICLDWPSVAVVPQEASTRATKAVLDNYPDVFTEGLGKQHCLVSKCQTSVSQSLTCSFRFEESHRVSTRLSDSHRFELMVEGEFLLWGI